MPLLPVPFPILVVSEQPFCELATLAAIFFLFPELTTLDSLRRVGFTW